MALLFTCATNLYQYELVLLSTLANELKYKLTVCGHDMKWVGWRTKMKAYLNALNEVEDENAIAVCADAYDTLPLKDAYEFESLYKEHFGNYGLVASAESNCIPGICKPLSEWLTYSPHGGDKVKSSRFYANAGLICGTVKGLKEFWLYALKNGFKDDQYALGHYLNKNFLNGVIDHENVLMQTSVTMNTSTNADNIITRDSLNGKNGPAFLHLPGLKYFSLQRKNYSFAVKELTQRLNMEHILEFKWATRYVPFELDSFSIKILIALAISMLCCTFFATKWMLSITK